jgi:hypothetical protein
MSDIYQILNPNKAKDNHESLGKNPLKIILRKSKQKEAKRLKQGNGCPYYQADRALVKGMFPCRRL